MADGGGDLGNEHPINLFQRDGAGICASQCRPISFMTFTLYGIPLTLCHLAMSAVYVPDLNWFIGE
jgi:hypothetical protein